MGRPDDQAAAAPPPAGSAAAVAERAHGSVLAGRLGDAEREAAAAVALAEHVGDGGAWSLASAVSALVAYFRGALPAAIDGARAALVRAGELSVAPAPGYPAHYYLASFLVAADRFAEADEVLLAGRRPDRSTGGTALLDRVSAARRLLTGDWDTAVSDAEAAATAGAPGGTRAAPGGDRAGDVVRLVAACRGQAPVGPRLDGHPPPLPPGVAFDVLGGLSGALLALRHELGGHPGPAREVLEEEWRAGLDAGGGPGVCVFGPDLVRLCLETGDAGRASAVAGAVEARARRLGTAGARGAALRCRGLVGADPDAMLAAAAAFASVERVVERAFTLEEAGVALGEAGRRSEAVAALVEALNGYEALGAGPVAARVRGRVRALGSHRSRRRGTRPAHGWEALTASEERVVALVGRGMTNAQIAATLFVSRHTVESHVSHVFAKLGVRSRAELAALVGARGRIASPGPPEPFPAPEQVLVSAPTFPPAGALVIDGLSVEEQAAFRSAIAGQ